jgi:hypothetical protein
MKSTPLSEKEILTVLGQLVEAMQNAQEKPDEVVLEGEEVIEYIGKGYHARRRIVTIEVDRYNLVVGSTHVRTKVAEDAKQENGQASGQRSGSVHN